MEIESLRTSQSKVTMLEEPFYFGQNKAGRQIGDPNHIQNAFELLDRAAVLT